MTQPAKAAAPPTTAPLRLEKISLVILYAKDVARSAAFYRDVLGMRVVEESPRRAQFDGGGAHLAVHQNSKLPAERGVAHPRVVFDVSDPHAAYAALAKCGVAMQGPLQEVWRDEKSAGLAAEFEDPDGNLLSILGLVPRAAAR